MRPIAISVAVSSPSPSTPARRTISSTTVGLPTASQSTAARLTASFAEVTRRRRTCPPHRLYLKRPPSRMAPPNSGFKLNPLRNCASPPPGRTRNPNSCPCTRSPTSATRSICNWRLRQSEVENRCGSGKIQVEAVNVHFIPSQRHGESSVLGQTQEGAADIARMKQCIEFGEGFGSV